MTINWLVLICRSLFFSSSQSSKILNIRLNIPVRFFPSKQWIMTTKNRFLFWFIAVFISRISPVSLKKTGNNLVSNTSVSKNNSNNLVFVTFLPFCFKSLSNSARCCKILNSNFEKNDLFMKVNWFPNKSFKASCSASMYFFRLCADYTETLLFSEASSSNLLRRLITMNFDDLTSSL